jgi:hypothetical protein
VNNTELKCIAMYMLPDLSTMKSGWQCGIHRHGIIQEQEDPILSPFLLSQVDDSQYHVPKYSEIIGFVLHYDHIYSHFRKILKIVPAISVLSF